MEELTITRETPTERPKKRKSKKDDPNPDAQTEQITEERKAKRRKKQDDVIIAAQEKESTKLKKKKEERRSRREVVTNSDNRVPMEYDPDLDEKSTDNMVGEKAERVKRKRKSKKEKLWLDRQAAASTGDLRLHEDPARQEEVERTLVIQSATGSAKKKKRTNKTGFPDPNEDTLLSDQARKALSYAFTQFYRPSKWKFRKAQQNWIIRNVLSGESIPERYLPLTIAYLVKVQGGARENLLKHCRVSLEPPKVQASPPETTTADASVVPVIPIPPPAIDLVKLARAKSLIQTLDAKQVTDG